MNLHYVVDERDVHVKVDDDMEFSKGEEICLANKFDDLALGQDWYSEGYTILQTEKYFHFHEVRKDIENVLKNIVSELSQGINLEHFSLEDYHKYVDDRMHHDVISKTRRLYPVDFGFNVLNFLEKLSTFFNIPLCYKNSVRNLEQWIIVRLNRPKSIGFNPVHKDIYGMYDEFSSIPRMINIWIPICGVGNGTGLPVVPRSHLITENNILRTPSCSIMENQKYSVNCIKTWNSENRLTTLCPKEKEMIVFSSHLIHGLAQNLNPDKTRVSLEFRLYEKI